MKNFSKAGLLIITLVIPALIFIFLKFFARNHYDLPYFNAEYDSAGTVVKQNGDTVFHAVSDQIFVGKQVGFAGKLTIIHYLPENCGDSCKLAISQLQRIAALHSEIPELNVMTLAGDLDKQSTALRGANGKDWSMLRYPGSEITTFLEDELGVNASELLNYQDLIVLVDSKRYVRGYYRGADPEEIDRLMAEIKILAYEGKPNQ
ncbi:hypothetical protein [Dyadobacter crusticola]|uniref:hypothetical protein n=1 Tax=Dyadobacter crusticola TaxID=292407 RepID=UPI0004E0FC70|nr:hypothetical protein [Dyadobacter crusticola]